MRERVYRAEAVVLRRLSLGETDRVVTLFTRELGKLAAVAKGARGPRSKLGGATEPFTYFRGLLAVGQELDVLTQAEVQDSFAALRRDLVSVGYASYFVEIADAALEERQPAPEMWELLLAALSCLESATMPDLLARAFELHALSAAGYQPRLTGCVLCGGAVNAAGAVFHPLRGGMLCPRCARGTAGTVAISRETLAAFGLLAEAPFFQSARADLPPAVRKELERALIPFVRNHLQAPLRSLQFLDDVREAP